MTKSEDNFENEVTAFNLKESRLATKAAGSEEMTALAVSDTRLDALLKDITEFNAKISLMRPNIFESLFVIEPVKSAHSELLIFLNRYNDLQPYYLTTIESNDADMKKAKTMGHIMSEQTTSIRWRESLSVRMTAVSNNLSLARQTTTDWRSTALAKLSIYLAIIALLVSLLTLL